MQMQDLCLIATLTKNNLFVGFGFVYMTKITFIDKIPMLCNSGGKVMCNCVLLILSYIQNYTIHAALCSNVDINQTALVMLLILLLCLVYALSIPIV